MIGIDTICSIAGFKKEQVSLTFQSWNRAELNIALPPVTLFPTMGVEIEFDITRLLYAGVNARREVRHKKRMKLCTLCTGIAI